VSSTTKASMQNAIGRSAFNLCTFYFVCAPGSKEYTVAVPLGSELLLPIQTSLVFLDECLKLVLNIHLGNVDSDDFDLEAFTLKSLSIE